MKTEEIKEISEKASLIINGYAFLKKDDGFISILNLNDADSAMVVTKDAEIIETNMDPIEQEIVLNLCRKNLQFLEEDCA